MCWFAKPVTLRWRFDSSYCLGMLKLILKIRLEVNFKLIIIYLKNHKDIVYQTRVCLCVLPIRRTIYWRGVLKLFELAINLGWIIYVDFIYNLIHDSLYGLCLYFYSHILLGFKVYLFIRVFVLLLSALGVDGSRKTWDVEVAWNNLRVVLFDCLFLFSCFGYTCFIVSLLQ